MLLEAAPALLVGCAASALRGGKVSAEEVVFLFGVGGALGISTTSTTQRFSSMSASVELVAWGASSDDLAS